ncbi:hypothetical protein [Tuwongella immobilis]|uniref:hypothetical protein n=1 Tax=Tuwongella immobilis TaxID=692036 RepID=UPI0013A6D08F|nr:hypothetical protein [Tuwongella immobilis]
MSMLLKVYSEGCQAFFKQCRKPTLVGRMIIDSIESRGVEVNYNYYSWFGANAESHVSTTVRKIVDKKVCGEEIIIVGFSWGGITAARIAKMCLQK